MNTKQVAALTGVSVRTLHHYDEIGLLCPGRDEENGYRQYSDKDLDTLQQILFFRACGFPLGEIRQLLCNPGFNRLEAFQLQRRALQHERARIDAMLETLDKTIQSIQGGTTMSTNEKFKGFDFSQNPYEQEARDTWGADAVNSSNAYIQSLGREGQQKLGESFDALFTRLGALVGEKPDSERVQAAMAEMYEYFDTSFGYHYGPEGFANLGRMYVQDARFTKNIDKYAPGLAALLSEAMPLYAEALES